ncbi:MAG: elongation factor G [Planctomycetes bacterium]|nr:elongation factor G [Planctomycetota bacterium]
MTTQATRIHTVALVGHGDSGKTTFLEHALHKTGAIARAGSVAEKSTVSDYDAEERDAGHSIDVSSAHLKWHDKVVEFVDTPGYPDFAGGAIAALWACDTALIFVSATTGVAVNTRRMWELAGKLGKARVIVVTKLDAENADPVRAMDQIRAAFGPSCRPFNLPVGAGAAFKGAIPCFDKERPAPGGTLCGDPHVARTDFLEVVVEGDDALLEKYLAGEEVTHEEAAGALTAALVRQKVAPVLFCSSTHEQGVGQVLDLLAEYAPSAAAPPGVRAKDAAGNEAEVTSEGPFLASVFKVASDQHVGKISYLRVWRGTLPADGIVWCSSSDHPVKLAHAHPARPLGKELQPVQSASAGDIICVTKVEELKLCCTISDPSHTAVVAPPEFPVPMAQYAVVSKVKGDEHKIATALHKVQDEDPCLHAERNPETHELVLTGLSTLHLEVVLKRMHHRYKADLEHHLPRVPLKETVLAPAEGHWRHKKQTGGRGQFAEVHMRVMPNERGKGFEFRNGTIGGSIPHNFIPAVEKGIHEQMAKGVIAGYEVVDVIAEVLDGKSHPVDSSEAAFKIAGARAFRDAVEKATHALLEPMVELEIDVPSRSMGDVTGDLNSRRGRILGLDSRDDRQVIRATAPLSEVQKYSTDLRSMTSGEGSYTLKFSHLDPVPANVAKKYVDHFQKTRTADDDT